MPPLVPLVHKQAFWVSLLEKEETACSSGYIILTGNKFLLC